MQTLVTIRSRNSSSRTTNTVGVWLKSAFANLLIALDAAQRKRADKIFQRYAHLISDSVENAIEQKETVERLTNLRG